MVYVDICLKITGIFSLAIQEKLLMAMGELDVGPRQVTLPTINKVITVDFLLYMNSKDKK